jgi:hypothetical protein
MILNHHAYYPTFLLEMSTLLSLLPNGACQDSLRQRWILNRQERGPFHG